MSELVKQIFDFSLNALKISSSNDYTINKKLLSYEKNVFKLDTNVQKLLKNKIDYKAAIKLLEDKNLNKPLPLNLKWLKSLSRNDNQIHNRTNFGLKISNREKLL